MSHTRPRILVLGAHGGLGRALVRHFSPGFEVTAWTRADLDLGDLAAIPERLAAQPFGILLNPAGLPRPDTCEEDPELAKRLNVDAPRALAEVCARQRARFIHFSTDYVFDGVQQRQWSEDDPATPINTYGRTKLAGERAAVQACPRTLVARVSWLFGPDKLSHPDQIIAQAGKSDGLSAIGDKTSAPTYTHDLCCWIERLITHHPDVSGPLHLCNGGSTSWQGWAAATLEIAAALGLHVRTTKVTPISLDSVDFFQAPRPPHTTLRTSSFTHVTGITPRDWRAALSDYLQRQYGPA